MSSKRIDVKEREQMYRMIISQLFYDGYQSVAVSLSGIVNAHPACPPSDKLQHVVAVGMQVEEEEEGRKRKKGETVAPLRGIDLEFETDVETISPEASQYGTCYVTAHKGPCRAGAFQPSGQLVATGSEDASIKILDIERMLNKSNTSSDLVSQETPQQLMENHPVIRTLYDHAKEITWLDFHPTEQILASGSKDFTIKIFDFSKPSAKKATRNINEAYEVRSLNFHPSGDYLVVGTEHPTLRLYDVNTAQCYVSSNPKDQHNSAITMVQYSPYGNLYASASEDGDIRVWDGVSNKCVAIFNKAHDGETVCSVMFSKNGKYILSSGMDSLVKLWELSMSRCLIAYTGAGTTGKQQHRTQAVFNHTEDYVFFPDERANSMCCWDSRNADRQQLLPLGHNGVVRHVIHSRSTPAFLTCSDDFRARFWYRKAETDY